jgi:hypothetical protein
MEITKAIHDLQYSLARDDSGTYQLPCRKAFLRVKVHGTAIPFQFTARDKVRFRIGPDGLTIEKLRTGTACKWFAWRDIENVAAGEPETDSGLLFQG